MTGVRVRFPPSPTGYLHVGGARTALFNWLLARKEGGVLVLRIEDTDRDRSSEAHTQAILDGMTWLGLDWDEGPFFQSDGVERHRAQAIQLLDEGKAYRDFTDPAALRAEAEQKGIGHPSVLARRYADEMGEAESARRAEAGEPFAIRLRVPEGSTSWHDLVHGRMSFDNADIDDLVILRADGSPIYNLAVVSDDAEHRITHVIRGDDHLSNTPKQILLYEALGLPVPTFGHVPMILGSDGKRLSKRHGATAVGDYAGEGILPAAMVNFLALLGWNPGDDREIMGREELIEAFSMERVQKKSAVFDLDKLGWMNGQYLARLPADRLEPLVVERMAARTVDDEIAPSGRPSAPVTMEQLDRWRAAPAAWREALLELLKVRVRSVDEIVDQAAPFLAPLHGYEEAAAKKHFYRDAPATAARLRVLREALAASEWTEADLESTVRGVADAEGVGAGKAIHPLRLAVTGRGQSPGIFEVLVLLGREETLERVANAGEHLNSQPKGTA